ncbi:MAG: hydroxymethylbilane synthase [Clostridiales bacterium]|nr:hydroxymethylbilane synthase [Clostridiales bacterium]
MAYFPMFIDINDKTCVVIGGGNVAKRKAETLISFGARVKVVAAEIKCSFEGCEVIQKKFDGNDIENAFIVIAATNDRYVNREIGGLCRSRGIFVNIADSAKESSFIFGASIKRDNLVISVNSGENNPKRSKRLKEEISEFMDKNVIRIGTRKSRLAKIQTEIAVGLIKAVDKNIICDIAEFSTEGDENQTKGLDEFGGKGAFTGSLERALLEDKIDIAVHSGKDLPVVLGEGLEIIATPKREKANDVIVTLKGRILDENSVLGTSSERRSRQIKCKAKGIRGNVETRLKKIESGEYDGVVLAYAGLKRLGLMENEKYDFKIQDTDKFIPAPCQGIIAVEGKKNGIFNELLRKINDKDTFYSFLAERGVVTRLGMGCHFPIGVYSEINADTLILKGAYFGEKTEKVTVIERKENAEKAAALMADKLKALARGEA